MVIFGHVHRYIAILPNPENRIQIYAHMRKYAAKTYVVDKIEGNDRLDHWKKFRRPPNNMFNAKSGFESYDVHSTLSKQWSHLFIYASELYVNQAYHLKCPINQQNYASWFKPLSIFRNWANDAIFTSSMIQKLYVRGLFPVLQDTESQTQFGSYLGHIHVTWHNHIGW